MATLTLQISGCRSDRGLVRIGLVNDPAEFPQPSREDAWIGQEAPIDGGHATAVFEDLAPGRYAVAVYHDENGNGRLDTNFLGLPKEGFAFGNDTFRAGKPRFDECAVEVPEEGLETAVHIRYLGLRR